MKFIWSFLKTFCFLLAAFISAEDENDGPVPEQNKPTLEATAPSTDVPITTPNISEPQLPEQKSLPIAPEIQQPVSTQTTTQDTSPIKTTTQDTSQITSDISRTPPPSDKPETITSPAVNTAGDKAPPPDRIDNVQEMGGSPIFKSPSTFPNFDLFSSPFDSTGNFSGIAPPSYSNITTYSSGSDISKTANAQTTPTQATPSQAESPKTATASADTSPQAAVSAIASPANENKATEQKPGPIQNFAKEYFGEVGETLAKPFAWIYNAIGKILDFVSSWWNGKEQQEQASKAPEATEPAAVEAVGKNSEGPISTSSSPKNYKYLLSYMRNNRLREDNGKIEYFYECYYDKTIYPLKIDWLLDEINDNAVEVNDGFNKRFDELCKNNCARVLIVPKTSFDKERKINLTRITRYVHCTDLPRDVPNGTKFREWAEQGLHQASNRYKGSNIYKNQYFAVIEDNGLSGIEAEQEEQNEIQRVKAEQEEYKKYNKMGALPGRKPQTITIIPIVNALPIDKLPKDYFELVESASEEQKKAFESSFMTAMEWANRRYGENNWVAVSRAGKGAKQLQNIFYMTFEKKDSHYTALEK